MSLLAGLFLLTALIYASVGFGGGSTYTALLALSETDYAVLPVVSLACNLTVVTGGVIRFARAGQIPWRRAAPLCALSVPMAWLGGYVSVPETAFIALLAGSLLAAGLLMLLERRPEPPPRALGSAATPRALRTEPAGAREMVTGGGLGFLSGMVGIGGGIFLSPVLHLTRWSAARQIAGTASLFILVNSAAGLAGHLTRLDPARIGDAAAYWPLVLAVLVGGQLGSMLGVRVLSQLWLKRLTAILILFVSARLFVRLISSFGGA